MSSDVAGLQEQLARLCEAVHALAPAKSGSDVWSKLGTVSTLFSSVILGAVGLYATQSYNRHQLEQARLDSQEKSLTERAQVLEKFAHYITSAQPQEREFGYAMFANLGQADLALKLIALNKDQAGISVVESLKTSDDPRLRAAASQLLPALQVAAILVTEFEGLSLKPVQDPSGAWTIGVGHRQGVGPDTPPITLQQAMQLLGKDLEPYNAALDATIKVPLTAHQRAALISFMFQVGTAMLKRSAIATVLNAGHYDQVPNELGKFDKIGTQASPVMARRRQEEIKVWNTEDGSQG